MWVQLYRAVCKFTPLTVKRSWYLTRKTAQWQNIFKNPETQLKPERLHLTVFDYFWALKHWPLIITLWLGEKEVGDTDRWTHNCVNIIIRSVCFVTLSKYTVSLWATYGKNCSIKATLCTSASHCPLQLLFQLPCARVEPFLCSVPVHTGSQCQETAQFPLKNQAGVQLCNKYLSRSPQ